MISANKILYLTFHDPMSKGVANKINGFANAAKKMGYKVDIVNGYKCKSLIAYFKQMKIVIKTDAKFVIFRSLSSLNLFFFIYFLIARLQGKILTIDVPTPMHAGFFELINSGAKKWKIWIYGLLCYLNGPWIFWIFNKIIQYGDESLYFSLGNKKRTIQMGNGIEIDKVKMREKNYKWPDNNLILVGVAQVSFYHGFDRVIKAIHQWNNTNINKNKYNILFHIIGDGSYLCELKKLVKELDLEAFVIFHGLRDLEYIDHYYSTSHLAVSTLGFYRIQLKEAAALKSREYCLAGIPFIATGNDPDFPEDIPFRMAVKNDSNIHEIVNIFDSFPERISKFTDEDIREYALKHLSYEYKLQQMGFNSLIFK